MNRRQFLIGSSAAFISSLVAGLGLPRAALPINPEEWTPADPQLGDGPAPLPEITAVVDIIVPADPEIEGDFKGSDYYGDWVLAATLGEMGQLMAVQFLNKYARQTAGKKFINCTPEEQLTALKQWIIEREELNPTFNQMLSGILTVSMIGTYEVDDPDLQLELFESMNWYDPNDPSGTFHIPCEGYVDAKVFPVTLKKGLKS